MVRLLLALLLVTACQSGPGDEAQRIWPAADGAPAVVVFHGYDATGTLIEGAKRDALMALNKRGYLIATSDADGNAWGNARSVATYQALVDQIVRDYHPSRFVFVAESMGALAALHVTAPHLALWVGVSPVVDAAGLAARSSYFRASMDKAGGVPPLTPRAPARAIVVESPQDELVPPSLSRLAGADYVPCEGGHVAADCWWKATQLVR